MLKSSQPNRELIVDCFAGGGGTSLGIEMAGLNVDIAINHDLDAIEMHKANHPDTLHFCENIWQVDPVIATMGRPVALAWFSPDCTDFSKANGTAAVVVVASDSVALWLGKLGSGGAGRMFKFLAENPGKQITRNQLALAAGLSASSGTFGTYLSKLRSNHLIVEQGGYYQINPEL
jgi:site-specific DNA-cytosine methylase